MRFLEGWPVPGNVVVDGLGHDLVSLIKDWIARCQVSGRIASARKYGPGWPGWPGWPGQLIEDWIARCDVFGRMASSKKYRLGWLGPGYGQFEKGLNSGM